VSKNPKGVTKARRRSTIKLQILIKLLITTDINTADIRTVGAVRIKINRIAKISKGDK